MDRPVVAKRIIESNSIPSLPNQLRHLLEVFNNEDLSLTELARVIEGYPSIAARLIALANSAWAAPVIPITSIERACSHLGLTIVRSISIGVALMSPFKVGLCPSFDLRRFWVSSKLVADAALSLANKLPGFSDYDLRQTVHTGGVLHNFGLLCLADILPRDTHQALTRAQNNPEVSVNAALLELLGTDFREIGALLAENWGLPQALVVVMRHYADPSYSGLYWQEARLVGCATGLVDLAWRDESPPATLALEGLGLTATDLAEIFDQVKTSLTVNAELAKVLF